MKANAPRRGAALFAALLIFFSLLPTALAQSNEQTLLECQYIAFGVEEKNHRSWQVAYSDDYFTASADQYNLSLSRASLGMALSAFRDWTKNIGHLEDNAVNYLHQAGFSNLSHGEYNIMPTMDTIATLIGSKKIGDITVVAVAVSGGGYKDEWKSNFLVGDELRSEGFNQASQKVQQRIRDYLQNYNISGDVRLWISGYSRAGAVSNITAADMTDSGLFTQVYGYTFATPRTTRIPGNYTNIFNTVGRMDPVPKVPLADWGYIRYGIDLYTPCQEYDSDYYEKAARADKIAKELSGFSFRNNPLINNTLLTVLSYLSAAYPTSAEYQPALGAALIKMWGKDTEKMVETITAMFEELQSKPEEQRQEVDNLVKFVQDQVMDRMRDTSALVERGLWNPDITLNGNLMHEHNPDVYLEWIYSTDDPSQLFSDAEASIRCVVYGNVILDIYDQYGFVQRVESDGSITYDCSEVGEDPRIGGGTPHLYYQTENNCTIVALPQDRDYAVYITSNEDQSVQYGSTCYYSETLITSHSNNSTLEMKEGDHHTIIFSGGRAYDKGDGNDSFTEIGTTLLFSPDMIIQFESLNAFHLSLSDMISFAVLIMVLLIALAVVEIILLVIRRIRKVNRAAWVTIVTNLLLAIFFYVLAELARFHLNAITQIYVILKTISVFWVVMLALIGTLRNRSRLNWLILAALAVCMLADSSLKPVVSAMWLALAQLILIIAMLLEGHLRLKQFIPGIILYILGAAAMLYFREQLGNYLVTFLLYGILIVMLPSASVQCSRLMQNGSILFAISNVLVGITWIKTTSFYYRAITVGLYLLCLFFFALSTWRKQQALPNEIPGETPEQPSCCN